VQEHLAVRENLATVVAALFNPPPLSSPRPFGEFGNQVLALVPDIQTTGWLPEVPVGRAAEAIKSMADSGVQNPRFIGSDGKPLDIENLGRPIYPIIDIAPERNRHIIGVDAGSFPERLAAIREARARGTVMRTSPLRLVQAPESDALLLYAPVFGKNDEFRGVMGFGYKVEPLFRSALHVSKVARDFDIRVFTHNIDVPLITFAADGTVLKSPANARNAGQTTFERTSDFGGRPLKFVYVLPRDLAAEGFWRGFSFAGFGLALTAGAVTLLGFLANRASTLAHEVGSRRSAEERLKMLIHELNHRVRNVLSVAQAVVRLSFTPGGSLTDVQRTCEGRLQALANAMSLLTATDWKSVNFRNLINEDIVPFGERIAVKGPDLPLKPRAAQTFALLLYELATNAAKHGAFSVPEGKVTLEWQADRSAAEPVFRLSWRELGGPVIAAPTRRGFGELLVRRIAPRDVSGRATVKYEAHGFEYELEAPLKEVVYQGDAKRPENRSRSAA
jgi:two-component sensor histidine kinase